MGRRVFAVASSVVLLGVVACGPRSDSQARSDELAPVSRVYSPDTLWQRVVTIGGSQDDTMLQLVANPVADDAGLYVTDVAAKRVLHFDHAGNLIWAYGREGAGPGELRSPRDIRLDANGRVWVLDARARRVVILSPEGTLYRSLQLHNVDPIEIVPLMQGGAVVVAGGSQPFVQIDSMGEVVRRFGLPWPKLAELNRLATQVLAAANPTDNHWYALFRVGDGFVPFNGTAWAGYRGRFVERMPFPVPVVSKQETGGATITRTFFTEQPTSAAIAATLSPTRLYVLFGGKTDRAGQLVDSYARRDGSYVETFTLPISARGLAWYDGGMYILSENPYPEISFYRQSEGTLP